MPTPSFETHFWDKDFMGNQGYEVIFKRLKDGKKTYDDFCDMIRQRAKIEEEYGRSLIKLSQHGVGNEEIGTLKRSLEEMTRALDSIGCTHVEFSKRLQDGLDKGSREFRERQQKERKRIDDKVKRFQKDKKTCYESLMKSKRAYEERCREKEQAEENVDAAITPNKEEKLRQKLSKTRTLCETADTNYQSAVKSLDDTRIIWEKEMLSACKQLQMLEEERIAFMRHEAWIHTNLGSLVVMDTDKVYEEVRRYLEKCVVEDDIQEFIQKKQTGTERPAPISYENFYYPTSDAMPQEMFKPDHATVMNRVANRSGALHPPFAATNRLCPNSSPEMSRNVVGNPHRFPRFVKAAYDHIAEQPHELSVLEGDVIEVFRLERNERIYGKLSRTGEEGFLRLEMVFRS